MVELSRTVELKLDAVEKSLYSYRDDKYIETIVRIGWANSHEPSSVHSQPYNAGDDET